MTTSWSPSERWALEQAEASGVVNLALSGGGDDKKGGVASEAPDKWPTERTISAACVSAIMLRKHDASANRRGITIRRARIVEALQWINEKAAGTVRFDECYFDQSLKLSSFIVDGDLEFKNCWIAGELHLHRAIVNGELNFIGTTIQNRLVTANATVQEILFAQRCRFEKGWHAGAMEVGSTLRIEHVSVRKRLNLQRGIFNELVIEGGTLESVDLNRSRIDAASIVATTIEGDLRLAEARFESLQVSNAQARKVDARGVRATTLSWQGGFIGEELDLSRVVVDNTLEIRAGNASIWGEGARLILREASANSLATSLPDLERQSKRNRRAPVPTDMTGLRLARADTTGASSLASASAEEIVKWIEQDGGRRRYFNPQPYRELANVFSATGHTAKAVRLRMAMHDHECVARGVGFSRRLALGLSAVFIGYGYRSWRAAVWFAMWIALATWVGYVSDLRYAPLATPQGWADFAAWMDWAGFAFGNSIPIVTLDASHATFLQTRFCPKPGSAECYSAPWGLTGFFYTAKVIGFIILSYLVAGLSGFAQRKD